MIGTDLLRDNMPGRVKLFAGDCLAGLALMPADSVHACITDPPYHLPLVAARMGKAESAPTHPDRAGGVGIKAKFHGKPEIVSDIAEKPQTWAAVLRVLKPGGYLLAFNGTKSYARMQVAAENAGFETRDVIAWHYATGFPHGKPLGKMLDRRVLGAWCDADELARGPISHTAAFYEQHDLTLKPATELILVARKPLDGTIIDNLVAHGTGAVDIGAARVRHETGSSWPANMMHDGSPEIAAGFPLDGNGHSAARFFWHPKADADDRDGSEHPTVKPIGLVRELVKAYSAPGQIVLDPFAGSGTTGAACVAEGRLAVLMEKDPQFQAEIAARMSRLMSGPEERERAVRKASPPKPFEAGTLFAGLEG